MGRAGRKIGTRVASQTYKQEAPSLTPSIIRSQIIGYSAEEKEKRKRLPELKETFPK